MSMSTTNGSMDTTSKRLTELYNAILGANVGFLPFALIFLTREAKVSPKHGELLWRTVEITEGADVVSLPWELVVLIGALTIIIVIHEWWLAVDFFHEYRLSDYGVVYQTISNVLYIVPVLFLGATLFLESGQLTLRPYAAAIASICIVDLFIVVPIWWKSTEKTKKQTAGRYAIIDLGALVAYGICAFYPMIAFLPHLSLFWLAAVLSVIYFFETLLNHFWAEVRQ